MFEDLKPFLRGLARRDLVLAPGETVFFQGNSVRYVFFVMDGAVELVRHQASGAPLVIQRAGPGAILAEASQDSARYHCAAVAAAKSVVSAVSKKELLRRMAENLNLALAFVRRLADELQRRVFKQRYCRSGGTSGWMGRWRGSLPPKGEWVGLAAELGVSPEALCREID